MSDIDLDELAAMVDQGYVRKVVHPAGHLELFNYTESCTYEGVWNQTTSQCRGLILNLAGEVAARPFKKFFNHGEPHAPELELDAPVVVTDKMDGSLGILYPDTSEWAIATRGSFTSDQALHATEVWRRRYEPIWQPPVGVTVMFEIVYPANRIVVDYGPLDDLVLLGARETATGKDLDFRILNWPGPSTETHPYPTLREALEAPPRPGQEGLVVFFPDTGERIKLKQEDYIAIHRLVFGLNARKIWENAGVHDLKKWDQFGVKQIGMALQMDVGEVQGILDAAPDGNWMDELLQIVPEEFGTWATKTAERIAGEVDAWEADVKQRLDSVGWKLGNPSHKDRRKDWALAFQEEPADIRGALFAALDGKVIRPYAWRAVRPEHETFKAEEEG